MTPQEPLLSWNIFVTLLLVPLSVTLLYEGIKRFFTKRDQLQDAKDKRIRELEDEKEAALAATLSEWRTRFSETQCQIKHKVDDIAETMQEKVTWEHCADQRREIHANLEKLDDRIRMGGR